MSKLFLKMLGSLRLSKAISCIALTGLMISVPIAHAAVWTSPDEISVAEVYNTFYGTSYDTETTEGFDAVLADHQGVMQDAWTIDEISSFTVLLYEAGSTDHFGLWVNNIFIDVLDPGEWTSPSRGWINDPANNTTWADGIIDIAEVFTASGIALDSTFTFMRGDFILDTTNTLRFNGFEDEFFLGFNNTGLTAENFDVDANEPLLLINPSNIAPVPVPAAVWLFGSGLIGLAGFMRRKKD